MLDRLNTDRFDKKKTCTVRLNGDKSQINATISCAEDLQKLLRAFRHINIYSMQIVIADETYNVRTGFTTQTINKITGDFSVADKITTPREIAQENPNAELSPTVVQSHAVPAIKTHSSTRDVIALASTRDVIAPNEWSGAREITIKEIQGWKALNKDKDIVINHDLKQIWPENTGKMPTALVELLQHVR